MLKLPQLITAAGPVVTVSCEPCVCADAVPETTCIPAGLARRADSIPSDARTTIWAMGIFTRSKLKSHAEISVDASGVGDGGSQKRPANSQSRRKMIACCHQQI